MSVPETVKKIHAAAANKHDPIWFGRWFVKAQKAMNDVVATMRVETDLSDRIVSLRNSGVITATREDVIATAIDISGMPDCLQDSLCSAYGKKLVTITQ